jgi:hypothetical protein
MNTTEARKPSPTAVTKESDLEKLIPGDIFQISFFTEDRIGQFVIYEGIIDEKLAVMIQDSQDLNRILSIRIYKQNMLFTREKYKGCSEVLVTRVEDEDVVPYDPTHSDYQEKQQLFHATYSWKKTQ